MKRIKKADYTYLLAVDIGADGKTSSEYVALLENQKGSEHCLYGVWLATIHRDNETAELVHEVLQHAFDAVEQNKVFTDGRMLQA